LLFTMNLLLFFNGTIRTAVAHAEFIGALTPLLVIPAAAVVFRERVPKAVLWLGLVALCGLALIIFVGRSSKGVSFLGDALIGGAICTWSAYLLVTKSVRATMSTAPFMAVLHQCLLCDGGTPSGAIRQVVLAQHQGLGARNGHVDQRRNRVSRFDRLVANSGSCWRHYAPAVGATGARHLDWVLGAAREGLPVANRGYGRGHQCRSCGRPSLRPERGSNHRSPQRDH
jgi:hypothetical protein